MANIDANRDLVTLVVVFDVDPGVINEKIEHVIKLAHEHSKRPGFVSCSIHKSPDGSRLVEYIQWATMEDFKNMRKTFKGESPQAPDFALKTDWSMLEVVAVVEAPGESATN